MNIVVKTKSKHYDADYDAGKSREDDRMRGSPSHFGVPHCVGLWWPVFGSVGLKIADPAAVPRSPRRRLEDAEAFRLQR